MMARMGTHARTLINQLPVFWLLLQHRCMARLSSMIVIVAMDLLLQAYAACSFSRSCTMSLAFLHTGVGCGSPYFSGKVALLEKKHAEKHAAARSAVLAGSSSASSTAFSRMANWPRTRRSVMEIVLSVPPPLWMLWFATWPRTRQDKSTW